MKLLFTIPHYFHPTEAGQYSSTRHEAEARVRAFSACLAGLHQTFGLEQRMLDMRRRLAPRANQRQAHEVHVAVCTDGKHHLFDRLHESLRCFELHECSTDPRLLGFECNARLRDALGQFDYYCYLEDDLVLHDAWFFQKLAWFTRWRGDDYVLQPNRYEQSRGTLGRKLYVDGDLRPELTAPFRKPGELPDLEAAVLDAPVCFQAAANPHAGSFFLNAEQMRHWADEPHFLDRDVRFIGPLESAATLGILKTFPVYKPARENAAFLEIEHAVPGFGHVAGQVFPLTP
ncbi:MAG: calcium-binding protein [Candidatus Saccharimonadales bacterium]